MVKITGPLNGLEAHGTLRHQITFRRHARGAIATRKPRHPQPLTPALAANAIALKFIRDFLTWHGWWSTIEWEALAKASNITPTNANLRDNLKRIRSFTGITNYPDPLADVPVPPDPQFAAWHNTDDVGPTIRTGDETSYDYAAIFRTTPEAPDLKPDALITFMWPCSPGLQWQDTWGLHGMLYYWCVPFYMYGPPLIPEWPSPVYIP